MNSITKKLMLYFTLSLLVFSIIISAVFIYNFNKHTVKIHKDELEERAAVVAQTLSEYMNNVSHRPGNQGGYGMYVNFLDEIAMSDLWIVDTDYNLITLKNKKGEMKYSELPENGEKVISEAFKGKTSFSESFSGLLGEQSVSVGVPVKDSGGKIIAAVLLHEPVKGTKSAVLEGLYILVLSVFAALIVSLGISMLLSLHFTKPIARIKVIAKKLSDGDYSAKTGVMQKDEIGELAVTMDILADRLYQASQESSRLEKMRRDFIANVSHELRTPVTVIRGSLEALCDGVVTEPEQSKEYFEQMLSETIFLQRLVNDLLDLSRLQNVDFKMESEPFDIIGAIEDAVRSIRHIAEKKGVKVIIEKTTAQFPFIGDYGRIRQMFIILLDNAVKFSKENGIVEVEIIKNSGILTVSVTDYGKGIKKEDLPFVFNRFYKIDTEKNKIGTGLGLAIAREIADRHNAKISAESEPDEKTVFYIRFSG